ncbi:tRNA pseudouridine(13) synthase TruD [Candidatus Aenigmatarchaeota archaeon]
MLSNIIKNPEDFVVEEVIDDIFFKKYRRTGKGMEKIKGKYSLFIMKKRSMTTEQAIDKVSRQLNVDKNDIGYAGLKDKFAVTTQYITILGNKEGFSGKNLDLKKVSMTDKRIEVGNLKYNKFIITLHNVDNEKVIKRITKTKQIPNYFGFQRFGLDKKNHIVGKFTVKRQYEKALDIINKYSSKKYSSIKDVPKKIVKFYINSYQSFLFNKMLLKSKKEIPIIGSGTKETKEVKKILKKEGIRTKDFSFSDLKIDCRGSLRNTKAKIYNLEYTKHRDKIRVSFRLEKGSYATVFISCIIGEKPWK